MKSNYVGIYCVALVVAFIYPPYGYDGQFYGWRFIWELGGGGERQMSYPILCIEIGIATLIFLAITFLGKK